MIIRKKKGREREKETREEGRNREKERKEGGMEEIMGEKIHREHELRA